MATVRKFKKRKISNMTLEITDDDDYVYCDECNFEYMGDCPKHQGFNIVSDTEVPSTCKRGVDEKYCWMTLPEGLVIKQSKIPNAGLGVFTTQHFPKRTRFGPYVGKLKENEKIGEESGYSWQIYKNGQPSHIVDGDNPSDSNWMRFINCARFQDEECVTAFQYKGQIYYRAHRDIYPGTEILVHYGDMYAQELGIHWQNIQEKPRRNPDAKPNGVVYCHYCPLTFPSVNAYVRTHLKYKHAQHFWREHHAIDNVVSHLKKIKQNENIKEKLQTEGKRKTLPPEVERDTVLMEMTQREDKNETVQTENKRKSSKTENKRETDDFDMNFLENSPISNSFREQCEKNSAVRRKTLRVLVDSSETEKLKCVICKKYCAFKDSLTVHKLQHTAENRYLCDVNCKTLFIEILQISNESSDKCEKNSGVSLNTIKVLVDKSEIEKLQCDMCKKYFACKDSLTAHRRQHILEKQYRCDVCGYKTQYLANVNRHKKLTHTREKHYQCNVCSFKTTYVGNLIRHKGIHMEDKPYKCDVCRFKTAHLVNLNRHKLTHTGEKPYECNVCSFRTAYVVNLNRHKFTHKEDKPYKCSVCTFKTAHLVNLNRHKFIHTGEKPYKCNVCRFETAYLVNFSRHKFTHTEEKPYKCKLCDYKCTRLIYLKTHKYRHTGERPYACDLCKYKTTSLRYLKNHNKAAHVGTLQQLCVGDPIMSLVQQNVL